MGRGMNIAFVRNFLIGAAIAAPIVCAAAGGYYWMSEPQQLKRACWDVTMKSLVAPSTARLIDFRLLAPGSSDSPVDIKLRGELEIATRKESDATREFETADKLRNDLGNRILSHQYVDGDDIFSEWERARAQVKELGPRKDVAALGAQVAALGLKIYRESKFAEIELQLDAQNRASALLRMDAVCVYGKYSDHMSDSVASVKLRQLEQR